MNYKSVNYRSRKSCDEEYCDTRWFPCDGKPGKNQTESYLGRKTWDSREQQRVCECIQRDAETGCAVSPTAEEIQKPVE